MPNTDKNTPMPQCDKNAVTIIPHNAIKNAYGKYYECLKEVIDDEGWCHLISSKISNDLGCSMIQVFRTEIEVDWKFNHRARPKALSETINYNIGG